MSDPNISKWKHRGKSYLWRYKENTKNYPGWHFSADEISCSAFIDLFNLMDVATYSGNCKISITPPNDALLSIPNNLNGNARYETAKQLVIKYDPLKQVLWNITHNDSTVFIDIGKKYLLEFRKGIEDIKQGQGDYSIGPIADENRLWFWWMPC
jgi:hypothetical protein